MKIILMKFAIITILIIVYIAFVFYVIAPAITHIAFGQFKTPDQFNNPQFNNQFGQNQFGQQGFDQNQFGQNQFQQDFNQYPQQYGTPYMQNQYGPYQQYPQQYGGFGIQEIIAAIVAGGGATVYARRRANSLEDTNQNLMAEVLKGKQVDAELARITYQMNQDKANQINDAPSIRLDTLQQDVNQFTDKTAKA